MDELDQPLTFPASIARAGRRFSNRTAYVESGAQGRRSLTWAELAHAVEDTAAGLTSLGLQRGDRVAICAENSIDWIVAYLATVTAGGIGVLVYFDLKPAEIEEQVERPGCRFLFASDGVIEKLAATKLGVEEIFALESHESGPTGKDRPFESLSQRADEGARETLRRRAPAPDDTAAIIYTSGTTGGAKGVMLSHRNLLWNGHATLSAIDFRESDSVLLVLPLHHAMPFLATLVLAPIVGAKVVIENDLRRIRDRLVEHKPTVFFGVPALYEITYRNILARAETEGRLDTLQQWQGRVQQVKQRTGVNIGPLLFGPVHRALGGKLRFLFSGGAALNPATVLNFSSLGLPLLQGWGMTEASPVIAIQRFSASRFRFTRYYEEHAGSVGAPVPGVEVRLIDVPDKDIRVGVHGEGEVIVRGQNVFQGYWQADDATREAKLDGWLRTGDLARIDKDGNIYLTGRSKYIIVLDSGEKVHPDELEAKLAESDIIEDICVTGRPLRGKTQVSAIVYPRLDALQARAGADGLSADAIQRIVSSEIERLGRELAAYKRVTNVELTDEPLPKTPLRKVSRGQLREEYEFDVRRWLGSTDSP